VRDDSTPLPCEAVDNDLDLDYVACLAGLRYCRTCRRAAYTD
jgi:hypothetical protein